MSNAQFICKNSRFIFWRNVEPPFHKAAQNGHKNKYGLYIHSTCDSKRIKIKCCDI
jgi:hypothetical protein